MKNGDRPARRRRAAGFGGRKWIGERSTCVQVTYVTGAGLIFSNNGPERAGGGREELVGGVCEMQIAATSCVFIGPANGREKTNGFLALEVPIGRAPSCRPAILTRPAELWPLSVQFVGPRGAAQASALSNSFAPESRILEWKI